MNTQSFHPSPLIASLVFSTLFNAASPAHAAPSPEKMLIELSQSVLNAQRTFDQAALNELLAPDYFEVSPVGDVDRHDAVLSFYSPEARSKALQNGATVPALKLSEAAVQVFGDCASVSARETIKLPNHTASLRVGFLFRLIDGRWRVQNAQYTPIR
jgi:hypothetical protein